MSNAYARSVEPDRREWRNAMAYRCMLCSASPRLVSHTQPLEVHEIERRSAAPKRWGSRSNYLLLCNICHTGPIATMEHAQQLAIKLVCDPMHFDLDAWLRIGDPELRAPERVTWSDIAAYLKLKEAA